MFEIEKAEAETRNVVTVIPYPQVKFNQFLYNNDIALVELEEPLEFNSNLSAVCLPEKEIEPRQLCVTAGWQMNVPGGQLIHFLIQSIFFPSNMIISIFFYRWKVKPIFALSASANHRPGRL